MAAFDTALADSIGSGDTAARSRFTAGFLVKAGSSFIVIGSLAENSGNRLFAKRTRDQDEDV